MPDEPTHNYSYTGLELQQQPGSPAMYLLTVCAPQLLEWADVPNAKADYMAGYQRVFDEDRARLITEFLAADPKNIVPGAIIVTASADFVAIEPAADAVVQVSITVEDRSFEERLASVYQYFAGRLSESEKASIDAPAADPASLQADEEDTEGGGMPDSYIAALTEELRQAVDDMSSLPAEREAAIRNYIESVSKPGLIIDGQHRVFGAKDVSQTDIRLPIILIPGLEIGEQVFHFYVLNNKAKLYRRLSCGVP